MPSTFHRFLADQSGATAIEYGLMCALIGLFILAAVHTTGQQLIALFSSLIGAF
jgi:pilus assembly protein Flp/PilA